jgi:hypothetical protein
MRTQNINTIAQSVVALKSHNGGVNAKRRQKEAAYILNSK